MTITLNGTTGITTPDITSSGSLNIDASAPDNSLVVNSAGNVGIGTSSPNNYAGYTTLALNNATSGGTYDIMTNGTRVASFFSSDATTTLAAITSIPLAFRTGNTERMRITAAGNLGINTSTPARTLHVKGGGVTTLANGNGALFTDAGNAGVLLGSDNVLGYISGVNFAGNAAADLVLQPFGSNVVVGSTSTNNARINSTFDSGASNGGLFCHDTRAGAAGGGVSVYFKRAASIVGNISTSSTSTTYTTSSDYRLKEDWIAVADASTRVNALKPINFAWISSGERVDGFLAHEVAEVVPEAVTGTKDAMRDEEYEITPRVMATYDEESNELTPAVEAVMGTRSVPDYQGIDQSKLVPLLTAALQEALAAIETLTARVSALEAA